MKIQTVTPATVAELSSDIGPAVQQSETFQAAAGELARGIYEQFEESVVLARVFLTIRFADLPSWDQAFVRQLAESAGSAGELKPDTPVLSLQGTWGQEVSWRDRRQSKGHAGIPLISAAFVAGIPMIARLLRELGLTLDWLDRGDMRIVVEKIGQTAGLFFVDDAATATDDEGRRIIADADFVSTRGIRSVFGAGTAYADGKVLALVVFCRDSLPRGSVENFSELATLFKKKTAALVESSNLFSADD